MTDKVVIVGAFKKSLSFLGGMLVGAFLGQLGIALPFHEQGILLSLIFLGLCLFTHRRAESFQSTWILCLFGSFHGNSHGFEVTQMNFDGAVLSGLLISTGILHCVGIFVMFSIRSVFKVEKENILLRGLGAVLMGSVLFFL